jgi:hypothetical protein
LKPFAPNSGAAPTEGSKRVSTVNGGPLHLWFIKCARRWGTLVEQDDVLTDPHRAQQERIDQAEDGSVRADPEGERQDGDRGERGILA